MKCHKCKQDETNTVFTPKKDGTFRVRCDKCADEERAHQRAMYPKIAEKKKQYREDHKEEIKEKKKKYYPEARARAREYYREQLAIDEEGFRARRRDQWHAYKELHPDRILHKQIKERCKERKILFLLRVSDITELLKTHKCPCCGISDTECKFDIDRVNPDLGYVKGNVHRICSRCNRIKSNGTIEDFKRIIKYIEMYLPN